jgi:hypothetical protein
MKTKIKEIWVVNQQGTKAYFVGREYDGLLLDRIENESLEFPDSFTGIYRGYTKDGDLIFETINAPTEVQYVPDENEADNAE